MKKFKFVAGLILAFSLLAISVAMMFKNIDGWGYFLLGVIVVYFTSNDDDPSIRIDIKKE